MCSGWALLRLLISLEEATRVMGVLARSGASMCEDDAAEGAA
jgi:hypothetical protein